jgi:ribonuclease Z
MPKKSARTPPRGAELVFVGTGEAFDPALPNTSLLYRGSINLLLDCGYSVPHAFWRISRDPSLLDAIYVSHQHADHSFGLPALLLWMRIAGRRRPLEVIGGPGVGRWLRKLLELGYPGSWGERCYPIVPVELAPGDVLERGAVRLCNARSQHGVRNLSLRLETASHAVAYSGDGAPSPATRALYTGADVLVHECYGARASEHGHASLAELLELARVLDLPTLCLLHLAREQKAKITRLARKARGATRIVLPVPGDAIRLK